MSKTPWVKLIFRGGTVVVGVMSTSRTWNLLGCCVVGCDEYDQGEFSRTWQVKHQTHKETIRNYSPTPKEMKVLRENWEGEGFPTVLQRLTVKEIWG